MSKDNMKERLDRLTEENHCLRCQNEELKYQLNDLQEAVNIANDEYVRDASRVCGCIVIDWVHNSAHYQDISAILLQNGYEVELTPVQNGTKLKITIKESEVE